MTRLDEIEGDLDKLRRLWFKAKTKEAKYALNKLMYLLIVERHINERML